MWFFAADAMSGVLRLHHVAALPEVRLEQRYPPLCGGEAATQGISQLQNIVARSDHGHKRILSM
jgi:hypothetical protein